MMRYLEGFDDSNHTASTESTPNHVAWCLGHCALTMHRAAERIDGRLELDGSFVVGERSGDARRFGTESVSFGSDPRAGAVFPSFERCVAAFRGAVDRLAEALSNCPESTLDEHAQFFGGVSLARWNVVPRSVFHNGFHCGQIADLRRVLKFKPVLG